MVELHSGRAVGIGNHGSKLRHFLPGKVHIIAERLVASVSECGIKGFSESGIFDREFRRCFHSAGHFIDELRRLFCRQSNGGRDRCRAFGRSPEKFLYRLKLCIGFFFYADFDGIKKCNRTVKIISVDQILSFLSNGFFLRESGCFFCPAGNILPLGLLGACQVFLLRKAEHCAVESDIVFRVLFCSRRICVLNSFIGILKIDCKFQGVAGIFCGQLRDGSCHGIHTGRNVFCSAGDPGKNLFNVFFNMSGIKILVAEGLNQTVKAFKGFYGGIKLFRVCRRRRRVSLFYFQRSDLRVDSLICPAAAELQNSAGVEILVSGNPSGHPEYFRMGSGAGNPFQIVHLPFGEYPLTCVHKGEIAIPGFRRSPNFSPVCKFLNGNGGDKRQRHHGGSRKESLVFADFPFHGLQERQRG